MKIEYARTIPLRKILIKLGFEPISTHEGVLHHHSPFSNDKSAYLRVDTRNNTWYDTCLETGGDTLQFAAVFLQYSQVNYCEADCLRWIKAMQHEPVKIELKQLQALIDDTARYKLRYVLPISNFLLLRYLTKRYIDHTLANRYLKELRIFDTKDKKVFRAIGLQNEDEGYAFINSCREGQIDPATITFIRGEVHKPSEIQIFKDIFDFMSVLMKQRRSKFKGDTIILNSYSCLNDVMMYITNYGYTSVKTWFPNDEYGELATNALASLFDAETGLAHQRMNKVYAPHVSPNEWLIASDKRIG